MLPGYNDVLCEKEKKGLTRTSGDTRTIQNGKIWGKLEVHETTAGFAKGTTDYSAS
jgi:hypothetical protein